MKKQRFSHFSFAQEGARNSSKRASFCNHLDCRHSPRLLELRAPTWSAWTLPWRLQDASKTAQDASKNGPDGTRRPKTPPNLPRSPPDLDFGRFLIDFWSIFDWFLVDFWSIFHRFFIPFQGSKNKRFNIKKTKKQSNKKAERGGGFAALLRVGLIIIVKYLKKNQFLLFIV